MDVHGMTDRLGGRFDDLRDKAAGALSADHSPAYRELARNRRALDALRERIDALDASTAERIEDLGDRFERGGSLIGRLFLLLVGAGLGAGAAYVMDPAMGRTRRSRMQQQLESQARDVADTAKARASYAAGTAQGAVVEKAKERFDDGSDPDVDPHTLRQRVESEVIGTTDGALDVVVVVHNNHTVSLKGRVADAATESTLIERTRQVRGVESVESELTTVG